MKCNAKSSPNYFPVIVSVLAALANSVPANFKKPTTMSEILGILKFVGEIQQLVRKLL